MFNNAGLSLEQAPPLSVVLRFFITAAVFGVLSGVALIFFGERIFDVSSNEARVLTHLLALGVMVSFMLGALFQMLPVIAGVVLQSPRQKATFAHLLFLLGVLLLAFAFYTGESLFFLFASLALGVSLCYVTFIMIGNLLKLSSHSSASKGMLFALMSFVIAIVLGLYLGLSLGGYHDGAWHGQVKQAHYSFALFGWVSLLIMAISFQVIEMFFVTPKYPEWIQKYLIMIVFGLLFIGLWVPPIMIALALIIYAGYTLHRLSLRKRPTSDASVWFWRFGMGMLMLSMILMSSEMESLTPLSYITFIFFALSIAFAMIYKIVPFLVWFHLSNQGYMQAPLMFDIIHPKAIKQHFYLHVLTFVVLVVALVVVEFIMIAGVLTIASFGLLLYHLFRALKQYRDTQENTQKMTW